MVAVIVDKKVTVRLIVGMESKGPASCSFPCPALYCDVQKGSLAATVESFGNTEIRPLVPPTKSLLL